jgi:membrane protein YqaA with SNARE-associated domain
VLGIVVGGAAAGYFLGAAGAVIGSLTGWLIGAALDAPSGMRDDEVIRSNRRIARTCGGKDGVVEKMGWWSASSIKTSRRGSCTPMTSTAAPRLPIRAM